MDDGSKWVNGPRLKWLIKIIFKDLEEAKVFLSSLYTLKGASEKLKRAYFGHVLSPQEKDPNN